MIEDCELNVIDYNQTADDCWKYVHDFNKVAGVDEYSKGAFLLSCEIEGVPIPMRDWWINNTEISL